MSLTIKLIQDIIKVNPYTKFHDDMSNGVAMRVPTHRHTHKHTHRWNHFYNLYTADAGGNDVPYSYLYNKVCTTRSRIGVLISVAMMSWLEHDVLSQDRDDPQMSYQGYTLWSY